MGINRAFQNWERWAPFFEMGVPDLPETPLSQMGYHAEFDRSSANARKNDVKMDPRVQPFKVAQGTDTDRSGINMASH